MSIVLACSAVTAVAAPGPAVADGPCGQDYTGNTACPVNSATTSQYDGTLVANNDVDYYVFHAAANTHLSLSITDTENPFCSNPNNDTGTGCGEVGVEMYDSQGNEVGGPSDNSQPHDGITVPVTWSTIISARGTYYLQVSGSLGSDPNNNPTDVPYDLGVSASPNVQWPPPPPPPPPPSCVVPKLAGKKLPAVRSMLALAHCRLGGVHRKKAGRRMRNRVVSQSPGAGAVRAYGYRVRVTLGR